MKKFFLLFCTCLLWIPVIAGTLQGRVIKVVDGDTIHILQRDHSTEKIRLAGIDAPERKQAHGNKAKRYLASIVGGKYVKVTYDKRDRYGRIVGKIIFVNKDINLKMVEAGYAWHYKKYQREQIPSDRLSYAKAENNARKLHKGLFQNPAIPPWEWRKNKKNSRSLKPKRRPQIQSLLSHASSSAVGVWVNLKSGIYHCPNTRYFRNTKRGKIMSEARALKSGYRGAHGFSCH